jgi:methionine synthase II (cobalamin-independent)
MKSDPLTKYKDVAVGVIDVRPGIPVESVDNVVRRINTAIDVLSPDSGTMERIWIKPDCGFRTTKDVDVSLEKLKVMVEAVKQIRESIE